MKPSKVLAKLRDGKPVFCTKSNLIDPRAIDIMGLAGFDCVWLCNEHVPTDWFVLENQIRAAKMNGLDTLVRISKGSYSDYIKPLEADATGIMVPHVFNAEEARNVVKMTKFMPLGRRPIDGGNADGGYAMMDYADYIKQANDQRFIILQIEDPEPLEDLEAIAALDGIDMLFFGPADFSQGIGAPGDWNHPKLLETRKRVAEIAVKHGKFAGIPASIDNLDELIAMGYKFLNIGADVITVGTHCKQLMDGFLKKVNG